MSSEFSAEQFMRKFIAERTSVLRHIREKHLFYWRRFHEEHCNWDSRKNVVENSASEEIVEIQESSPELKIITKGGGPFRKRYHLTASAESWLISDAETEIGEKWLSAADAVRKFRYATDRQTRIPEISARVNLLETSVDSPEHAEISRFMENYFTDRTVAWSEEAATYGKLLQSFFSPACEWENWVVSPRSSELEKVESITRIHKDLAHVITSTAIIPFRNRYQLRSTSDRWLIHEVDIECFNCAKHGIGSNCFWCKGTIWKHE